MEQISRRRFLQGAGALALAGAMPVRIAFADAPGDKRLLVIVLRGALDGLHAVVPYGDKAYADRRGSVALRQDGDTLVALDSTFALHAALGGLAPLYRQKEMLVLHATATPYRERSHFDAQNLLETGGVKPHLLSTGWLNRSVSLMRATQPALALGPHVPMLLRGEGKVTSWSPSSLPEVDDDFLSRVMHMYQNDPPLMQAMAAVMDDGGTGAAGRNRKAFHEMMKQAAVFMKEANGPRIASIDVDGWDTHVGQLGRLDTLLRALADGILSYRQGMGAAWKQSAVLVVTEFGRTVKGNGTGGTDHGTGSVAFLLGGAVNGGRIIGDWPGLAALYEDRDLMPANDLRQLLMGTLSGHLGIEEAALASSVFPGASGLRGYGGLFV